MKESSRADYIKRINTVLDYIADNPEEELSIEKLAELSAFSPYHFHRIFKAFTNETVGIYQRRIRLEKSVFKLRYNPGKSITDIAFSLGFNSSSAFNRAFKNHFGQNPSEVREKLPDDNILNRNSENIQIDEHSPITSWKIENLNPYRVFVYRFTGSFYDGSVIDHWCKHIKNAHDKGIINEDSKYLGIVHDDPDITQEEKCRLDCCISTDSDLVSDIKVIPGGLHAIFHFEGDGVKDTFRAYNWIYGQWFPGSGFEPGETPGYNNYYDFNRGDQPSIDSQVRYYICIPVNRVN